MTYEYVCTACGHEWEAEQRISEAPLRDCPSCGQPNARRQISAGAGFILKGGGWYSDGYASSKGGDSATKSDAKSDGSSSKTESKSDTSSTSDSATKSDGKKSDSGKAAAA